MRRRSKFVASSLIVALLCTTAIAVFLQREAGLTTPQAQAQQAGPRATAVEAAPVRTGTVVVDITAVGSLIANESVVIRPEIAGRITEINFSEGETVAKGDRLIALDDTELRAQLADSLAMAELNKLNFDRAKELSQRKLMSRQEFDQAQANLTQSQAQQALVQARLDKSVLHAPFNGVIGLRHVSPGDYVEPGQDLVSLVDIEPLKLDFRIPEIYLSQLEQEQEVEVHIDGFPNTAFNGSVYAIAPTIDETTRSILLRARILNEERTLRPGMFARVILTLETRPDALLIPEQALVPIDSDRFVYRVVDGKAVLQKVETGQRRDGEVEIVEGLSAYEMIVTAGQMKISDGAAIKVVEPPKAIAREGDTAG